MRKSLLILGLGAAPLLMQGQELQKGDVIIPESNQLPAYVEAWNGGGGNIRVTYTDENDKSVTVDWEDEEFFTSRVKPRTRITATSMNVNDFGSKAGRRSMWWVPIDDPSTQGLPNGRFNSEAFSMWSYIDVYGQWTAPYGWVTGAFADICHKNGVATGGQASMPWAGFSNSAWETCMNAMAANYGSETGAETLGKFLYYHGVDGLGYNSESSGWSNIIERIRNMHGGLMKYMADRNPVFENIWYAGTNDDGSLAFDNFLRDKQKLYASASMFSNYNWNVPTGMAGAVERANEVTDWAGNPRTSWYMYAGMNQQGGEPKTGDNYPVLKDYDWSMGWWGAHSNNMFWEGRGAHGTTDDAVMGGYLKDIEQFWGNGPRNPAIHKPITTVRSHRPDDEFFGVAEFINERSVLGNKLGTEPFYTYFNLGNGKFFNWMGNRVSDNEWYSIGVQDYLPTWRFWTSPAWLQKTINETDQQPQLKVGFTYEDAFFGGSCLKIEGSADTEYLHLFKSAMTGLGSKNVTIRYKLLEGTADVRLVLAPVNNPDQESKLADLRELYVFTTDSCAKLENQSYFEGEKGWQRKVLPLKAAAGSGSNMPGGLGVIGLEIKNAKGLKLLLGELSIMPSKATTTPAAPKIRSAKVLRNNFSGVDGKIIWTMDNDQARLSGTPKYNSDVNASMFRIWSREEGGEPQFLGVTTSWAAIAFRAPNTDDSKKIQFGVSAVSVDTRSESAITWSQLFDKGEYTVSEEIRMSKLTIKPGEEFSVEFADRNHAAVDWAIKTQAGETLASGHGTRLEVPDGLPEVGGYDLFCGDKRYNYYVQISDEKVGALPKLYSISNEEGNLEGKDVVNIKLEDHPVLSYTGRRADGNASRGLNLNSTYMGANVGAMGIDAHQSFTVSAWLRIKELPKLYYMLLNISNKSDGWPINTWGWMWCHGLPDGRMYTTYRGNSNGSASPGELHYTYPSLRLQPGVWTHICWVQEYDAVKGFRHFLYVNGVKQESKVFSYLLGGDSGSGFRVTGDYNLSWHKDEFGDFEGDNDGDIWIDNQTHPIASADWMYFGGQAHTGSAADAILDDFQVWHKALSAEEVKSAMAGIDLKNGVPEKLLCYWDFESDADETHWFTSVGENKTVKAASYNLVHEGGNPEAPSVPEALVPITDQGCPFLEGTAYPVVTQAKWVDDIDRKTKFEKTGPAAEDENGSAKVTFNNNGDHTITLTLANTYGSDQRVYPVYHVEGTSAIDGVDADAQGLRTYTVDRTLFVEFAEAGDYNVQVFNAAGMMVGNSALNAAAGQNARIGLGAAGVYLVKVSRGGKELRTIKVLSK